MGVVLDTSVLIAAEKGRIDMPAFAKAHSQQNFFITSVTAAELLLGVERANPASRRTKRSAFVEKILTTFPIIEYDLNIARRHSVLWAKLAASGKIIGPYDMIIAASALEYDHSLATLNVREFGYVPRLKLEDLSAFLAS